MINAAVRRRPPWTSDALGCGMPLDHGGKWIHGATSSSNPMTAAAAGLVRPEAVRRGGVRELFVFILVGVV